MDEPRSQLSAVRMDYDTFIADKAYSVDPVGFDPAELPACLKAFQNDAVRWSTRMGRSALFLSTGLGKTLIQLTWARQVADHTDGAVLILAPLAVGPQTVREAAKFGIEGVQFVSSQDEVAGPGIYVTNYEKLHKFDSELFAAVVLDEASILKSFDGPMTPKQSKMIHGCLCQCPTCRGRPLECIYCKAEADCICRPCEACDGEGSIPDDGYWCICRACRGRGKVAPGSASFTEGEKPS